MEQVKERIGADILILFGQTVSTGGFTQTLPDDAFEVKASTVGVPMGLAGHISFSATAHPG